jgi:hypothetical protein
LKISFRPPGKKAVSDTYHCVYLRPFPHTRADLVDAVKFFTKSSPNGAGPNYVNIPRDMEEVMRGWSVDEWGDAHLHEKVLSGGRPENIMGMRVTWDAPDFQLESLREHTPEPQELPQELPMEAKFLGSHRIEMEDSVHFVDKKAYTLGLAKIEVPVPPAPKNKLLAFWLWLTYPVRWCYTLFSDIFFE